MSDLKRPSLMWLKACLFALIGLVSCALILAELPSLRVLALLMLVIWSFSRAYYFCFYVIERYIDPSYKFAGLWSVMRYMATRRTTPKS